MSTTAPDFLVVPQHVARNPVARAIARQRMERCVDLFATRLYLLADGEQVESDGTAAARVLYVAYLLLDKAGQGDAPAARVIRGGISTVEQLALRRWAWRSADAPAIDQAFQRARDTVAAAAAVEVQRAWAELYRLEAQIDAQRLGAAQGV